MAHMSMSVSDHNCHVRTPTVSAVNLAVPRIPDVCTVLGYSGYPSAAVAAARELERIGVHPEVFWNIRSPFQRFIPSSLLTGDFLASPGTMSTYLGHYHIVKSALDRGLDSLWAVEDDVRFLKNAKAVHDALEAVPPDADFLILDGVPTPETVERLQLRKTWSPVANGLDVRSAGDYIILNRRAMDLYARHLDGSLSGKLARAADVGRDGDTLSGLHVYMAWPLLSIQSVGADSAANRVSTTQDMWRSRYSRLGIDVRDYS